MTIYEAVTTADSSVELRDPGSLAICCGTLFFSFSIAGEQVLCHETCTCIQINHYLYLLSSFISFLLILLDGVVWADCQSALSTSGSRLSDKGGGWSGLKKIFLWLFGPQFDLKIRGGGWPPGPSPGSATPCVSPSRAPVSLFRPLLPSACYAGYSKGGQRYPLDESLSTGQRNRSFRSSPEPLLQNEGRCSAFDMKMIYHSPANKTHFHKKGCAPSLILKLKVCGTRKWPFGFQKKLTDSDLSAGQ